jgi:hypothetical protein
MHQVNDGRFRDDSPVEIRFPRTKQQERGDRAVWPWLLHEARNGRVRQRWPG